MSEHLWVYIAATVTVLVVPGPDFVLVTRNTLTRGRTAGLATAAGIATGLAGYTALAALGVAVLVSASTTALVVLRFAGAGYLVLLGLQSLAALRRGAGGRAAAPSPSRSGRGAPFLQGLLNNSLNPKALVFFFTFMPQFVVPDAPVWPQTLFLGGTVVVLAAVWWLLYVLAIARLSALLRRPRVRQGIELTSGVALTSFGVALAMAA